LEGINILKAIAKKISNTDDIIIVFGFIPRPVMHINKKDHTQSYNKAMTVSVCSPITITLRITHATGNGGVEHGKHQFHW
jgi:hypothetical protein